MWGIVDNTYVYIFYAVLMFQWCIEGKFQLQQLPNAYAHILSSFNLIPALKKISCEVKDQVGMDQIKDQTNRKKKLYFWNMYILPAFLKGSYLNLMTRAKTR